MNPLAQQASRLIGDASTNYWEATPTRPTPTPTPQISNLADVTAAVNQLGQGASSNVGAVQQAAPSPDQVAMAQQAAQRTNLQKSIQKLVGDAMGVYDTLYGNLGTAAASQRQALEQRFATETGALGEQFTQEIPRIGQAYAARGAYRSTWRTGAEGRARENFEKQLQGLGAQKTAEMGKIGQEVATQEAQFRGGQEQVNRILAQLPNVTDVTELTALQNELQKRIDDLRVSQAGLQSQEAFVNRFQQLAPATDRMAQLQTTLSRIIAGEAPGALKQSVGAQIIASSGLTDEEKAQALAQFNAQVMEPVATTPIA